MATVSKFEWAAWPTVRRRHRPDVRAAPAATCREAVLSWLAASRAGSRAAESRGNTSSTVPQCFSGRRLGGRHVMRAAWSLSRFSMEDAYTETCPLAWRGRLGATTPRGGTPRSTAMDGRAALTCGRLQGVRRFPTCRFGGARPRSTRSTRHRWRSEGECSETCTPASRIPRGGRG